MKLKIKLTLMASTIFESKAGVRKSSSKILVATVELKKMLAITEAAPIILNINQMQINQTRMASSKSDSSSI